LDGPPLNAVRSTGATQPIATLADLDYEAFLDIAQAIPELIAIVAEMNVANGKNLRPSSANGTAAPTKSAKAVAAAALLRQAADLANGGHAIESAELIRTAQALMT
jgi:hypothetical protein